MSLLTLLFIVISDIPGYPYSTGLLSFPHDEGAHYADTVTSEWWYLNMDLVDENQDSFGLMLTHFRKPAVARIFNVTCGDSFYSSVKIFGSLQADTGHLFLTYRDLTGSVLDTNRWTYPEDSVPFSYLVKVSNLYPEISCSLRLQAFDRPFAIDSIGIVTLGDSSNLSYYYAMPFINVDGQMLIGGEEHIVHGIAWIDRQWGPFFVTPEGGYEWFSTVVSQNSRWLGLQIWNLFEGDSVPHSPDFRHLNIFVHDPDSTFQIYTSQFILERLGYFYDAVSQKYFSRGWRILWQSENGTVFLEMYPEAENQITTFLSSRFYEGITWISRVSAVFGEVFLSRAVRGYGFAELVQKYDHPITPPASPQFIGFNYHAGITEAVWHPSQQGTYPIAGYRVYFLDPENPDIVRSYITVTDTSVNIPNSGSSVAIMISAFDSSSAVNGSPLAGPFFFTGIREYEGNQSPFNIRISGRKIELTIQSCKDWSLKIYTPDGRENKSFSGTGHARLNFALRTGVYFTIFKCGTSVKTRKILVIQR